MRTRLVLISFVLLLAVLPASATDAPINIYTVNYPLKYFAEQIGDDHVKVHFPAPADVDPAYWVPDVDTIGKYQKADLILLNGAGYAKWIRKVSLPRSKLVDTSKSFKERYIRIAGTVTHTHGPGGEHAHEDIAFTTWLDLQMAVEQARAIKTTLSRKRPGQKDLFEKNFQALKQNLLVIDADLKTLVSKDPSQPLLVSHPVYDYFKRRYDLSIESVHWEPDEEPNYDQVMELQQILKNHPARWMIWEGKPLEKSIKMLGDIRIGSLVFDPCGNIPDQGDFLSVMKHNVKNLKPVFK